MSDLPPVKSAQRGIRLAVFFCLLWWVPGLLGCGSTGGGYLGTDLRPGPATPAGPPVVPAIGAYIGALLLEGQTSMPDFNRQTGIRHAVFADFFRFPECVTSGDSEVARLSRFLSSCRDQGAMAMVTIETFNGLAGLQASDSENLATLLAGSGVSVFLRWNHEMNGSWYPWGQQPRLYIERFRQTAAVIHRLAANVAMVWTPNQGWGYPWAGGAWSLATGSADLAAMDTNGNGRLDDGDDPYSPYYPGDDAVDWVGHSFYHWSNVPERGFNQIPAPGKWGQANGIGSTVPRFHDLWAVGHGKPMMIAETSALYDPADRKGGGADEVSIKTAWISQVYNVRDPATPSLARDFPMIKAIFWFSQFKFESEVSGNVDWRVTSRPEVVDFYRETVLDPYFVQAPDVVIESE